MLALTRKMDQRIQIGSDICITILHVRGKQVRLGIEAPRQVRVTRAELAPLDLSPAANDSEAAAKPAASSRRTVRRRTGSPNPGERAFSSGRQPLAAKLHACRAPRAEPVAVA
jgi:carbon storage regulator CsrA